MWNRLTAASATNGNWGEQYAFDDFGNLTGKTPTAGSAPAMNWPGATNQTSGTSLYDANGNPYGYSNGSGPGYLWDVENHLATDQTAVYTPINYTYDPWGRRVWKQIGTGRDNYGNIQPYTGEIYFYGATGQKLETYSFTWESSFGGSLEGINIYFGKKLLQSKGVWVATDKLGSVRANSSGESMSYWPYGEERDSTANGREKFATYTRDGVGQDYAEQRYYNSSTGAFWTPDPGGIKTANPNNPSSWNRYAYTKGNPIGRFDPHGLEDCDPDDPDDPDEGCDEDPCATNPYDVECGGGGPGPQQPVKKKKKAKGPHNPCNDTADVNFVKSSLADAQTLASNLKVPVQWVLAVAADESQYGGYPTAQAANNYFGIHSGTVAVANGSTGPYAGNPIFAAWAPGTDGFLASGNTMVSLALSDGAQGAASATAFFTDINAQFGVGNASYVSDMLGVLNGVTARLKCP